MVVGDIVSYSAIAENAGHRVLLENIDRLYAGLRQILSRHRGTLSNYAGDAFFATWEVAAAPDAARAATAFAVEAARRCVDRGRPGPARSRAAGRCGWDGASSPGPAAVSLLTGMLVTVLGDATNVALRLSGLAGRDGRPDVLVNGRRAPRDRGEFRLHPGSATNTTSATAGSTNSSSRPARTPRPGRPTRRASPGKAPARRRTAAAPMASRNSRRSSPGRPVRTVTRCGSGRATMTPPASTWRRPTRRSRAV